DADREAARALKGERRKRRKRKGAAGAPWYQKPWLKAAGILLALAAIGIGVYLAVPPPSPESLYAAIEKAPNPQAKLEAAERYLSAHGERGGERTDKAAAVFREEQVRKRESQLATRFAKGLSKPTEE